MPPVHRRDQEPLSIRAPAGTAGGDPAVLRQVATGRPRWSVYVALIRPSSALIVQAWAKSIMPSVRVSATRRRKRLTVLRCRSRQRLTTSATDAVESGCVRTVLTRLRSLAASSSDTAPVAIDSQ